MVADDSGIISSNFGDTSAQNRKINDRASGKSPARSGGMDTPRFVDKVAKQGFDKLYGVGKDGDMCLNESVQHKKTIKGTSMTMAEYNSNPTGPAGTTVGFQWTREECPAGGPATSWPRANSDESVPTYLTP